MSDGKIVGWLELKNEYERLHREQLREATSGSSETQASYPVEVLDSQHRIPTWLVSKYDVVFVED